jgi:hypothetical protein
MRGPADDFEWRQALALIQFAAVSIFLGGLFLAAVAKLVGAW